MKLLSIDTSTDYLSLAVTRGDTVIAKVHRKLPMMHSTLLVPTIASLLKKARLKLADLDALAVSVGPGSFTGLRIGVTTVKALAYAIGKPIVAVPTLDVIAHNALTHAGIICPVLDARKGKVYACVYRSDGKKLKRLSKHLLLPLEELMELLKKYDDIVFLGDMAEKIQVAATAKTVSKWHPRAEIVARYGAEHYAKKRFVRAMDLEPMYLYSRECDIKGY
jgi:tRNA threonylcarbamoyladenosine biosynthesis protein TsaB